MHFNLVSVAVFVLATTPLAVADGGYVSSCYNIQLGGTELTASCTTDTGNEEGAGLNLDSCIGNSGGELICGEGGYSESCWDCSLTDGNYLGCTCWISEGAGTYDGTSFTLNDCIGNQNGVLAC